MKPASIGALYSCLLFGISVAHAAVVDGYAYAWTIQTQGSNAAWQVELTPEVYAAVTTADLRDVAVINAAGEAVPSARAPAPPNRIAWTIEPVFVPQFLLPATRGTATDGDAIRLQIERGADGRLRRVDANVGAPGAGRPAGDTRFDLLLDASSVHVPLSAVHLGWKSDGDVTAEFAIDGSDDLQQWRSLVTRATVLELSRDGYALSRQDIVLNGARAAYLRLRRLDDGPALERLSAELRSNSVSNEYATARQWLTATTLGPDRRRLSPAFGRADGSQVVAWRYRLPAPLSIDALRLELADDNSLARVVVLSRQGVGEDDPAAWLQRANLVAFRLRQDDSVIGNDEMPAAAAARAGDWRIESATPLDHAPQLSVGYQPDRFVFLAQGAGPYRLVAGSATARRGDYPVDAALASLRASRGKDWQPILAALGPRAMLAGESVLVAKTPERTIDWKTWLLWAVLIGAAALIAGLALSLLRGGRDRS
jgi:hypothetical protein